MNSDAAMRSDSKIMCFHISINNCISYRYYSGQMIARLCVVLCLINIFIWSQVVRELGWSFNPWLGMEFIRNAHAVEVSSARVFYIDAIDGVDGGNGLSPDSAWNNIDDLVTHNANSGFLPGDSILFRRGAIYISPVSLQFKGSGVPGNPITIGAYGEGVAPIIMFSGLEVGPWEGVGDGIWLWRYTGNVVNGLWDFSKPLRSASNETLIDGQWFFKKGLGIYYRPLSDENPSARAIYRANPGSGIVFNGNSDIIIRDLHFQILGLVLSCSQATSHDFVIENNIFENIVIPIDIFSKNGREISDVTIRNNHMRKVGYGPKVHSASGVERAIRIKVINNVIEDVDKEQIYASWFGGFYDNETLSFQNLNDSEISGNHISGGGALGGGVVLWTNPKSGTHRNIFASNFICNIAGPGFALFNSSQPNIHQNNKIYNNIICNHDKSISHYSDHNNRRDDDKGGLRLNGYDTEYSNIAFNNTIYGYDHNVLFNSIAIGWVLINNISAGQNISHLWRREGELKSAYLDYNVYDFSVKPDFQIGLNPIKYNMLKWKRLRTDIKSIQTDPQLENASNTYAVPEDFSPRWSSSVIDAGTDLHNADDDYFGNAIYGIRDIGAVEYQPPYVMGIDPVDIGGNVRVYGDGKYRNTKTPNGNVAMLSVKPLSGNTREWIDINIIRWDSAFSWVESSTTVGGNVAHRLDGLMPNALYTVYYAKNNDMKAVLGTYSANNLGALSFEYDKGFPVVEFSVESGEK